MVDTYAASSREDKGRKDKTMLKVTFKVYEPVLNKTFINTKEVKKMEDFTLYAKSLWSGNWTIISVCEEIERVG